MWSPRGWLPHRTVVLEGNRVLDLLVDAPATPDTERPDGILLPGWVNAHTHLELSYLRGAIPQGGGFAAFAQGMRRTRQRMTLPEREAHTTAALQRMEAEGVRLVGDIANGDESFVAKAASPLLTHTFIELFGLDLRTLDAALALLARARAAGLEASLTLHALYSVQDALLAPLVKASAPAPLSIHFMESPDEQELFRHRGPLWAWYRAAGFRPDFLGHGSPVERLVRMIPRDRRVILVHDCCVDQAVIDRVMNHFTAPVGWVLCPGSNAYISGVAPPAALLARNGLQVAVGTDSLASNTQLSMVSELARIPDVPLAQRLEWAIGGGARVLGAEEPSIEPGACIVPTLLEGIDWDGMRMRPDARARRL